MRWRAWLFNFIRIVLSSEIVTGGNLGIDLGHGVFLTAAANPRQTKYHSVDYVADLLAHSTVRQKLCLLRLRCAPWRVEPTAKMV